MQWLWQLAAALIHQPLSIPASCNRSCRMRQKHVLSVGLLCLTYFAASVSAGEPMLSVLLALLHGMQQRQMLGQSQLPVQQQQQQLVICMITLSAPACSWLCSAVVKQARILCLVVRAALGGCNGLAACALH